MKWEKTSDRSIKSGNLHIARFFSNGSIRYLLWDGERIIGNYHDADEAKTAARGLSQRSSNREVPGVRSAGVAGD
jgi:hypothetical protein